MGWNPSPGLETTPFHPFLTAGNDRVAATEMIEEEIIHWWRDEAGELHRNALRLESDTPQRVNGFPRDGIITLRLMNTASQQAMKLSPEEALKVSTQLLAVAKELMNAKRLLWNEQEEQARA